MRARIVLFDGFDPLDVIARYEVLVAGGQISGGALPAAASAEGSREATPVGPGPALCATAPLRPGRADPAPGSGAAPRPAPAEVLAA
ncbi:hypothetical protein [Streptomyces sp. MUM 178J]|uniref:hypothetical protein n=1 Tax=Streptomyces sp. MUM 178J TaxID=2791991 RepID=UPI0027E2C744|nr:hypothetical protein [Streptomyces sp. MUM 178J]WRQ80072.1 hypothetical protein I3F59_012320 [Streptomyces sp. MUM 178J]